MSAPVPEVIGRYRILHKLGEGGMGSVWLAEDLTLRRQVALKVPHFPHGTDPRVLERFRREARIAAQIDHPNFCPVLDVGEDNGQPYLVMPLLKGKPLSHYIRPGEPWPPLNAVRTIAALASALASLHALEIVHRDLKPANVMVKETGDVVLMDFGLARPVAPGTQRLTATGAAPRLRSRIPSHATATNAALLTPSRLRSI